MISTLPLCRMTLSVRVRFLLPFLLLMPASICIGTEETDPEYELFLKDHADQKAQITEIETALAQDEEAEESVLAYADSLDGNPDLAAHESALYEATQEDPILLERQTSFEELLAEDPEASGQMATMDSLLAADKEFAERMEEVERLAGEDDELLDGHGDAIAYLESNPNEAEKLFAQESGPTYAGSDPAIVSYVAYLTARPPLYRAWWRLYRHLRTHPRTCGLVYAHWRWYRPRARLWHAWWSYRLRAAHHPHTHRLFWARRLYLGHRPALARTLWRHRCLMATRPALRVHTRFLQRHPNVVRRVANHRHWVRQHTARPARLATTRPRTVHPKPPPPKKRRP